MKDGEKVDQGRALGRTGTERKEERVEVAGGVGKVTKRSNEGRVRTPSLDA